MAERQTDLLQERGLKKFLKVSLRDILKKLIKQTGTKSLRPGGIPSMTFTGI